MTLLFQRKGLRCPTTVYRKYYILLELFYKINHKIISDSAGVLSQPGVFYVTDRKLTASCLVELTGPRKRTTF